MICQSLSEQGLILDQNALEPVEVLLTLVSSWMLELKVCNTKPDTIKGIPPSLVKTHCFLLARSTDYTVKLQY